MSFDQLGVAVTPGAVSEVNVTPLAGTLEDFTVESSDETVATATVSLTKAGGAATSGVITVSGVGAGSATITVSTESGDERQFPVTVYDPTVLDTGEMLVKIVDTFEYRWKDKNSGADRDGSAWQPVPPEGYHALGAIGSSSYAASIDGQAWAIVVKDKGTNPDRPPFVEPASYEKIITVMDWTVPPFGAPVDVWRPIPPTDLPDEYVAVGTVVGGDGTSGAVCVRKDLTAYATSTFMWNDAGSGSSLPLVSFWRNDPKPKTTDQPIPYSDPEQEYLGTGCIIMRENRGDPSQDPNYMEITRVLKIKPEVLIDATYPGWEPELTSLLQPPPNTQPILTRTVLVPFTAFQDPAAPNLHWLVENTPFYVLERRQYWNREYWADLGATRGWKTGITEETANASWEQQEIEVTANLGFEFKGISGGVTATVTQTLGFASSRSVSSFEESSTDVDVPAPPEGSKVALWRLRNQFLLWRQGDGGLEQFLDPWTFDELAFVSDTYPK